MLLQRWGNAYSYARLDRAFGTIDRLPPGWGRWQRSVKRRRPTIHGFFDSFDGMRYALFGADGRIFLRLDAIELPLDEGLRVHREDRDGEVVVRLVDRDLELFSTSYRAPRPSRDERLIARRGFDFLLEPHPADLFELAESFTSDPERVSRVADAWSSGLRL